MSKPEGVITIGKLDDEQLRSGIKTLVTEIKDAVSEMAKATETATSSMEKSLKKIISVNNMMIDEFKKTREESKKTKNTLDANKQTIDNLKLRLERGLKLKADTTDLDELNGKLNQVRLALGKLKAMDALRPTQIVAYEAAIERLEKKIKSLTDAQDPAVQKAQANADRIRNALDKAMKMPVDNKSVDELGRKLFQLQMNLGKGMKLDIFSQRDINRYEAAIEKIKRKIDELNAKQQSQGTKETPMAQNATQAAMSYDRLAQSMARVNAIDNLTKPNTELQKLNEQLRQGNSLLQQRERELARTTQRPIIKGEDDLTGAFGVKSARESFLAFQQGFKQQAEAVAKQIQEAEQALNTAVGKRVTDIESKITTTKQKISELNLEITKQKELQQQTGNYSQYNASLARSRQELEVQLDRLRRLQEELAKAPDTFKQSDAGQQMIQQINTLRAEHERLLNVMKDEANVSTQQVTTTQQQAQATQQVTKELENQKKSGPVFVLGPGMSQLAEVGSMRQVTEEELKQKEAKELQAYYDRQLLESSQQRVGVEHQLTTESKEQKQNKNAQKPQGDVDAYRESIAKLLGVQKNEVILAEQMVDSIKRHQASLKQLKEAYDKLPRARKDSDFGKALLTDINITERSIAQLRKQASRPIDLKAAMGGSEKTIDDISYKIQRLKQYLSGLDYTKQANEIKQVNSEIDRLNKKLNQQFGQNQKLEKSNNALARSWNYMKNRLAFYFTVGASTAFVKNLIEIRSQYELTERALGILIDSAQRGSQIFRELSEMALKSPYTLIDLSGAAKQLSAYDIAARDIVDTTRRLADITAAVGIPIDRLTYALGQIKAYGYLNARDARMFSNAGIPLVRNLADMYSQLEGRLVSVSEVYDRIKKKSIDETDVLKVIYQMTDEGGKFFNFQEKAADTLKVQLANLTLAWNNMLNDIGESNQSLISAPIEMLKSLFMSWQTIKDIIDQVVIVFGAYKAVQIATNALTGASVASLKRQALAEKQLEASRIRRKALTEELTVEETALLNSTKLVTAADYQNALSSKNLTKQKALLLAAFNRNNVEVLKALIRMELLTASEIKQITVGKAFVLVLNSIKYAISGAAKAVASFVATAWPMLLLMGATELFLSLKAQADANKDIFEGVKTSAREAIESIDKFKKKVGEIGGVNTRNANELWEELRNEIENSAASATYLIPQLMEIDDKAERVHKGLEWADRIKDANDMLAEFSGSIGRLVTKDMVGGLFGEGIDEDLEDYNEALEDTRKLIKAIGGDMSQLFMLGDVRNSLREANSEIEKTAEGIADLLPRILGDAGMKDPLKVREAVERIKNEIKKENPKIQGDAARLFDLKIDELLAKQFSNVYDRTTSMWGFVLKEMKKQNRSAFEELSEDTEVLPDSMKKSADNAIEKLKQTLPPEFAKILDEMKDELDSKDFIIRVKAEADLESLDAVQKDFLNHFKKEKTPTITVGPVQVELPKIGAGDTDWKSPLTLFDPKKVQEATAGTGEMLKRPIAQVNEEIDKTNEKIEQSNNLYNKFNRKTGEGNVAWEKRINDRWNEVVKEEKLTEKMYNSIEDKGSARAEALQSDLETFKLERDVLEEIAKYETFSLTEKGGKKSGGSKKDPLAEALKQEISLIKEVQSNYDKLRKAGVDSTHALSVTTDAYGNTLKRINAVLKAFGVSTFDIKAFTGKNPREILQTLQKQLSDLIASGKGASPAVKDLEVEIQKLIVDAKTYDTQKIVDGLNNELGKIKSEYELAVELFANPELGDAFSTMFGIDPTKLPQNFQDIANLYQDAADKAIANVLYDGADVDLNDMLFDFDLLRDDLATWAKETGREIDNNLYKALEQGQKYLRDTFKKNMTDTEKMLDDYVKKYGDYSDKMAAVEASRLAKIKKLNEAYFTEEMRRRPEYIAKLNAIENGAERERGTIKFDEFKNSRLYVALFENLEYASNATLTALRQKLKDLQETMGELSPEQLKQVVQQYEKLDKELLRRNPFKNLRSNVKAYFDALKNGKRVQKEFIDKQKEVQQQGEVVRALKEQLEVQKDINPFNNKIIDALISQIGLEEEKLKKLKKELGLLDEQINKYNYAKKVLGEQGPAIANMIGANFKSLGELRDEIQNTFGELPDELNACVDGLMKFGEGLQQIVSSLTSGDFVGAVTGAFKSIVGLADGLFGWLTGSWKTARLNRQIKESKEVVEDLERSYSQLERTVSKAMGEEETQARRATIANKELQLSELERQLDLETQKRKKDQDDDAIKEYQDKIQELRNDIEDLGDDLINTLLGNDVKAAAEEFVDAWVSAWKEGEKTLDAIEERMDDMIFNLIKKAATSKIVGTLLQPLYDAVDEYTKDTSEGGVQLTNNELKALAVLSNKLGIDINDALGVFYGNLENLGIIEKNIKENDLSALQQGIQGITEDTAGALEAYMNSVSQQVYLHSDLLTQIRDAVVGMNGDVTLATNAQILLQLQESYQIQMSIQSILEGWSNPSGQAVKVELIN